MMRVRLIACACATAASVCLAGPAAAEEGCSSTPTGNATVTAVSDERTLLLGDGFRVRLAGLADLGHAGDVKTAAAAVIRAKADLARLAVGKTVAVAGLGEDRYGRRVGLVTVVGDRNGLSLQEQLIAHGYALVAARSDRSGCRSRFLDAERSARTAHLGLWADPRYLVRDAGRPTRLLAEARGRFALVEGTVLSVNDRGATVYVNFGRRWSEDFTVTIAKRNVRKFIAAGLDPQALAGRHVRIRGWIEERGGPWIEALGPAQVEIVNRKRHGRGID